MSSVHRIWFRIRFFVVVKCPLIEHDDGILWDEVTFIPVVLDEIVVHSKFGRRPPAHCFLRRSTIRVPDITFTSAQIQWRLGISSKVGVRSSPTTRSSSSWHFTMTSGFDSNPTIVLFNACEVVSLPASIMAPLFISLVVQESYAA